MKFCRVLFWCSCKCKKENWLKNHFKMGRNELSYLANEFRIKKRHFLELPDTIVKCCSDKIPGKINPIL